MHTVAPERQCILITKTSCDYLCDDNDLSPSIDGNRVKDVPVIGVGAVGARSQL